MGLFFHYEQVKSTVLSQTFLLDPEQAAIDLTRP